MTMPSGKYWIGDLCYVGHDFWDEFCEITIKGNECLDGEFTLADGRKFATYGTAYGDGSYQTNFSGELLGVDAGLIGCIKVDDISEEEKKNIELGIVVDFDAPFETSGGRGDRYWDGTISIGHVNVYTGEQEYLDDEDYEEEEDEDY